ncbi:MAG TPA: S41 family peptidase, partial [Chitinophagaceae bacterium]|nr:S41 family peptidase [Chitinophagaceae bacterium]
MMNKKLQVWLPLLFAAVMVLGMYFGYQLGGGNGKFFSSEKRNSLQEALDFIKLKYVDPVNVDSLETSAIEQMMSKLDPHSVYFPPVELKEANEDLEGKFEGGIGVEFNIFNDTVNIVFVMPGGPSDKAGIEVGDKILDVNGVSLVGDSLTSETIKNTVRGDRNSKADIRLLRGAKEMKLVVARGTIPVLSIDASFMMDQSTGYIKLNKFTESSYEEFMAALESLQKLGLKQLILDVRSNGGGYMDEAVDIADEFLDGDKLVVYTEGAHMKKREYKCKRDGLFEKGKLAVLVDENSASASEVLVGALQDWDRAMIIGRRTFGKGLVLQQYPLGDGSALRLTIARYYSPSG